MEVYLYDSTVCRLCGEENDSGTLLYSCEENNQTLSDIVNTYLPIKVSDDGQLPRTICPGCTIQLEATVEFLNLIIKGQKILRELHAREKEFKKSLQINSSKDNVVSDNIIYEINTTDGVYQVEHPIALQVEGLAKPKRKRGRPPKKPKSPEQLAQEAAAKEQEIIAAKIEAEELSGKRRRKTPTRFREAVQGKELDRIFKEEGVIDGDESDNDVKVTSQPESRPECKEPEVIGHLEDSGELVVVVKGKGRGRPKGRMKQTREECAICGMEFSCVGRYMSHVAQHGPVMYQCAQCEHSFTTRLTFTEHQMNTGHEGRNVIPCRERLTENIPPQTEAPPASDPLQPQPDTETPSVDTLISNVTSHSLPRLDHDTEDIKIDVESFNDDTELPSVDTLISTDHDTEDIKIDVESFNDEPPSANSSPEKNKEKADPTSKPRLKCNHCDKTFSNKQSKSLHIKASHLGERPYACLECGARFAYPRSLSLHLVSHRRHHKRGYACDLCGKVLNHPSSVVYHKEAEHAGQRYVCNKCGKSFKHKQLLQRHQLVHSQLRPYVCKTCNASFKTKANLLNHQLLHSGVKKFSCEICKHKFAHKTSLTLHMRWHTGQKPYTCTICDKSFSQKGNLSEHLRIHTGEKPYSCSQCPRRFTTSSQHRLHARRHQELAYKCHLCPKKLHARRHRKLAYKCHLCPKRFTTRSAWLQHARAHPETARPLQRNRRHDREHDRKNNKQISLLVDQQPTEECEVEEIETEIETERERVIYVTYDVDDSSQPAFTILDPDQSESIPDNLYPSLLVSPDHEDSMPMADGAPLQFTMSDGTRLAITSADGRSLQVVTTDGDTIPVEINPYHEEEDDSKENLMQQMSLQKTVERDGSSPVTHYFTIV